jgi:hypothetical protein
MVNGENMWPDRVGIVTVVAWPGCVGKVCCCDVEQMDKQTWPITFKCLSLNDFLGVYIWVVP